jgi:hypothetical protein
VCTRTTGEKPEQPEIWIDWKSRITGQTGTTELSMSQYIEGTLNPALMALIQRE